MKRPKIISLDVGGTLGHPKGVSIVSELQRLSPLEPREVSRLLRNSLHIAPRITEGLILEVSGLLGISPADFPVDWPPGTVEVFPHTADALALLSEVAPVVTLSNVSCIDGVDVALSRALSPWVIATFPSYKTGVSKPSAGAFQQIVETYGMRPSDLVHFGDDWECDIQGALDFGAFPVWISSRGNPLEEADVLSGPTLIEAVKLFLNRLEGLSE